MPRKDIAKDGKPFTKDDSRINRAGRPKLPDIKAILEEVLGETKDGMTAAEALMKKLRSMGAAGNIKAIEMLLDRAYGKPKQTVDTNITGIQPVIRVMDKEDAETMKKLTNGANNTEQ